MQRRDIGNNGRRSRYDNVGYKNDTNNNFNKI